MALEARELIRLKVAIGAPINVGRVHGGVFQVIPIIGGTFTGNYMHGKVLPGGADWNTQFDDGTSHVFAKYVLETSDGEFIVVENEGWIVPGSRSRIKTTPHFTADQNGKYTDLNQGVYLGELETSSDDDHSVELIFYRME